MTMTSNNSNNNSTATSFMDTTNSLSASTAAMISAFAAAGQEAAATTSGYSHNFATTPNTMLTAPAGLFPHHQFDHSLAAVELLLSPQFSDHNGSPLMHDTPFSDFLSPEFTSPALDDFDNPLVPFDSPWIQDGTPLLDPYTPLEEDSPFLNTPSGSRDPNDMSTSPLIDYRDNAIAADQPLFPVATPPSSAAAVEAATATAAALAKSMASHSASAHMRSSSATYPRPPVPLFHESSPSLPTQNSFSTSPALPSRHSFPSPSTASLPNFSPASSGIHSPTLTASPAFSSASSFSTSRKVSGGRKPSGFRNGAALIPLDAPTQPRNYLGPSSTAPKDLPETRKRSREDLTTDEDDTIIGGEHMDERQRLEAKRRKNALSARKSRQLKKETKEGLEQQVEGLMMERDHWRALAMAKEQELMAYRLREHGM